MLVPRSVCGAMRQLVHRAEVAALAVIVKNLGTVDLPNEYKLYVDVASGKDVLISFQDIEY